MASNPCAPPDWQNLPSFDRNLIPGILFGPTCLPGTATAKGCPANKAYWSIAVPWDKIKKDGWTAPGGNRYYEEGARVVDTRDPLIVSVLRYMAEWSRKAFRDNAVPSDEPMAAFLARATAWVPTYGVMSVEVQPKPDETLRQFLDRGGYLIDTRAGFSGVLAKAPLATYRPQWISPNVARVELWAMYVPTTLMLTYTIRIVYKGEWDQIVIALQEWWTDKIQGEMCPQIADPKVATGVAALSLYPPAAACAAIYAGALRLCAIPFSSPPCPPIPVVDPGVLVTEGIRITPGATAPGKRPMSVDAAYAVTASALAPASQSAYPTGSIALLGVPGASYRVAIPQPGNGTTHVEVAGKGCWSGSNPCMPPLGVRIVLKGEWEKATLPWIKRGSTKIGIGAGAGVAALAALAAAVAHVRS